MQKKPLNPEITALADQLGLTRERAGKYGLARLKQIRASRQMPIVRISKPVQPVKMTDYVRGRGPGYVERMVELASKRKMA
jgi:hypothetical protein